MEGLMGHWQTFASFCDGTMIPFILCLQILFAFSLTIFIKLSHQNFSFNQKDFPTLKWC